MAQAVSVHIERLTVRYGAVRAVDDLSLDVEPGEILALLGPSGCGKTTTLRVIGGLVAQNAGTVRFGARAVDRLPPHRRNVGLVFQNYALFPHMTVFDNVRFGLQMHRVPRAAQDERVYRALDLLQIREHEGKFPDQLSGGQQQRVALARTLVVEPEVVLLDEPLSALDRKLRDQMRVEIRDLLKRLSVTSVIVTHDQEEALTLADRVAVMRDGRIEQIGSPQDIYHRPRTRFVADFIGQTNHAEGTVAVVEGGRARVATGGGLTLDAETDGAWAPGDSVDMIFRPESVRVLDPDAPAPDAADAVNRVPGTLVRTVFTGDRTLVYVRADGHEFVAARSGETAAGAALDQPGRPVLIEWPVAATRIVA